MVLECDQSQGNILVGGAWGTEGASLPWTETFICSGEGRALGFRGDVEHDYYQGDEVTSKHSQDHTLD